ncbi:MAG: hypothetical protein JSR19_07500 [Proteobacteria bacterium]|nr:hypothetical protein [Pseudomonadota bacterium]HQR03743.1 hypothetical protein [Rhodocyclaceae bacterium]
MALLTIVALGMLYLIVSNLNIVEAKFNRANRTQMVLAQAKEALIAYAATWRDQSGNDVFGYLPCPNADGTGVANPSTATTACAGFVTVLGTGTDQVAVGLLPYSTLGLGDLRDDANACLWYAVSPRHKNVAGAYRPTPLNWDTRGQIRIVDSDGVTVLADPQNGNEGGAVAVIFAAGTPIGTQNRTPSGTGPCGISAKSAWNTYLESVALDTNGNFASSETAPLVVTRGIPGSSTNNDQIVWITPRDIFSRVLPRQDFNNPLTGVPPGQINTLTDQMRAALDFTIQQDLMAGSTPVNSAPVNRSSYTQPSGRMVGELPTTLSNGFLNMGYGTYYAHWLNQYRDIVCSNLGTPCLTINGTSCRGALMFAGQGTISPTNLMSRVRASADATNLAAYFEPIVADPGGGLNLLTGATPSFNGSNSYLPAKPSADVGACLFPGTFISFAQNIAGFNAGQVNPTTWSPLTSVSTGGTKGVTLGGNSPGSGCVWYPSPFTINTSLRLYFTFVINSSVMTTNGFTLTLADASIPQNNPGNIDTPMCGGPNEGRLGYSGIPQGGTQAGIAPPKIGIEFDNKYQGGYNDTTSDHFAFLYWGFAADNGITSNSGNDDNVHGNGITGSGYEPQNPRSLSITTATMTPYVQITGTSWSPVTDLVTVTTSAPHGFTSGQTVMVSSLQYRKIVSVTVTGATKFTYSSTTDPGTTINGGVTFRAASISTANWNGTSLTISTTQNHGLAVGQYVNISGINPGEYNGIFPITRSSPPLGGNQLELGSPAPTAPGVVSSNSMLTPAFGISSAIWQSATPSAPAAATFTTSIPHGLSTGQLVTISGIFPSTYNGSFVATVINTTQFSVPLANNPGGTFNATSFTAPGFAKVSTLPYFPSGNNMPRGSTIHVRLDISRTYDAVNHRAILTMKGYMDNLFNQLAYNCVASDFQNLSRDLSDLCPSRPATIEQDMIPINDVVGSALSSVYVGFTNSRAFTSITNQNIVISNFVLRSQ